MSSATKTKKLTNKPVFDRRKAIIEAIASFHADNVAAKSIGLQMEAGGSSPMLTQTGYGKQWAALVFAIGAPLGGYTSKEEVVEHLNKIL